MKRYILYILICVAAFVGCTTTTEGLDSAEVLVLSTESVDMDCQGGNMIINVDSYCPWSITKKASDSWVTTSVNQGDKGRSSFKLTLAENTTVYERSATITVENKVYGISRQILVNQEAGKPFITASISEINVPIEGSTTQVTVNSNVDYTISSTQQWCSVSRSSDVAGSGSFTISVYANASVNERTATVKLVNTQHRVTTTINVTQSEFCPELSVSDTSLTSDSKGDTQSVIIESNFSWRATCAADWVTLSPMSASKGTNTLKITTAENMGIAERTATIEISNSNYSKVTKKITITQEATALIVQESEISVSASATTKSVLVRSNIPWVASCNVDWVTLSPTSGVAGDTTLELAIAANDNVVSRTAEVTLANLEHNRTQVITIYQEQLYALFYTSSDGKVVDPAQPSEIDANIVSNIYEDGKGVMLFDAPITKIGYNAFAWDCYRLTSMTLPSSLISIGRNAFAGTSFADITIPDSVTSIGIEAFAYCDDMSAFYGKFASDDNKCLIVNGGVVAFAPFGLTEYTIPDGTRYIEQGTFAGCDLTKVVIPEGVTGIGYGAFQSTRYLKEVVLPEGLRSLDSDAFRGCGLESVTIPSTVISIGGANGGGAFSYCENLQAFYGKYASEDNRCLVINGELSSFAPAGLTEYTIPSTVAKIATVAFGGCYNLEKITIPESVVEIGNWAFRGCSALKNITIPSSVTNVGSHAFDECNNLTDVYCKPMTPPWGYRPFLYYDYSTGTTLLLPCNIYVPTASVEAYKAADGWKDYADKIVGYDF